MLQAQGRIPLEADTRPGAAPGLFASAYRQLAQIMALQAQAKRELMRGNATGAVALMQQAVRVEDAFGYIEPPRLYQPARQCLCFAARVAGDAAGAAESCSADLREYPSNVWSLAGLGRVCRVALGPQVAARLLADGREAADAGAGCGVEQAVAGGGAGLERACGCVAGRLATAAAQAEVPVPDSCVQLL
jgi:hypothetical protein